MSSLKQCDTCGTQTKPVANSLHTTWFVGWHGKIEISKTNEYHGTFDFCSIECLQVFATSKINDHVKKL